MLKAEFLFEPCNEKEGGKKLFFCSVPWIHTFQEAHCQKREITSAY